MEHGRVTTVFFDFGGVLVEHIAGGILAGLRRAGLVSARRARAIYAILVDDALQLGRVSCHELLRRIETAGGAPVAADRFRAILAAALAKRKEPVWAIARRLGGRYRLSIISDMPTEWIAIIRENHDLSLFRDPVFSSEVGMTKRDERIFRHALERHGVKGGESIFIDDIEENVLRARECGMDAVLFRAPARLRVDLAKRGLPTGGSPRAAT